MCWHNLTQLTPLSIHLFHDVPPATFRIQISRRIVIQTSRRSTLCDAKQHAYGTGILSSIYEILLPAGAPGSLKSYERLKNQSRFFFYRCGCRCRLKCPMNEKIKGRHRTAFESDSTVFQFSVFALCHSPAYNDYSVFNQFCTDHDSTCSVK